MGADAPGEDHPCVKQTRKDGAPATGVAKTELLIEFGNRARKGIRKDGQTEGYRANSALLESAIREQNTYPKNNPSNDRTNQRQDPDHLHCHAPWDSLGRHHLEETIQHRNLHTHRAIDSV